MENIKVMRSAQVAPVDTMGCHKCADTGSDPKVKFLITVVCPICTYNYFRLKDFTLWLR